MLTTNQTSFFFSLYFQEYLFPVEDVQERPYARHVTNGANESRDVIRRQVHQSTKEEVAHIVKIDDFILNQINGNRVQSDNHEEERPLFEAPCIDDEVKHAQQDEAPATGIQCKRAGPQFLDDRKP